MSYLEMTALTFFCRLEGSLDHQMISILSEGVVLLP